MREGKRTRTKFLDVRAIASPLAHPRVGTIVPKRGRTTVDRNRLKRRLRELIRVQLLPWLPSIDLIVQARPEAYTASFRELEAHLVSGVDRLLRSLQQDSSPEML